MTRLGLSSFSTRIRIRADGIQTNANRAARQAALAVDQAVVLGTPVDKGVARSNWLVSLNTPRFDTIPAYAPGNRLGKAEQANAAAALAQAAGTIRGRRSGQDIWVTNNIGYIGTLNAGSSQQAPENFVEMAVMNGVRAVRNVRLVDGN